MRSNVPNTVFLAGSTVELIAALACLAALEIKDAVIFVEGNISFNAAAMDPLLAAARSRFPNLRFIDLAIERPAPKPGESNASSFFQRLRFVESIRKQWDAACRANFKIGLNEFGRRIQTAYFTGLHDYVLVFFGACHEKTRILYPHGFDHPRRQLVRDYDHLVRPRGVKTMIKTMFRQKKHFGPGGLALGIAGRMLPGISTMSLPFTGVDEVLTFRDGIDFVPNNTRKINGLAETFQWLLQLQPWAGLLQGRRSRSNDSVLLLLPECNRHPIWEQNLNFGVAHHRLLRAVFRKLPFKRITIKAHVRSDGSAAEWLAEFLRELESNCEVEILPAVLHGIPVEALTFSEEFVAGCSLASCSLPPGLGFGIPHFVSHSASKLFDEGWRRPFWLKYHDAAAVLIDEGICTDVDES